MIKATTRYHLSDLKELVRAGADLNLQNEVTLPAELSLIATHKSTHTHTHTQPHAHAHTHTHTTTHTRTHARTHTHTHTHTHTRAHTHTHYQEGLTALMISSRSGRTELTETLLSGQNISVDLQTVRKRCAANAVSECLHCTEHWMVSIVLCC